MNGYGHWVIFSVGSIALLSTARLILSFHEKCSSWLLIEMAARQLSTLISINWSGHPFRNGGERGENLWGSKRISSESFGVKWMGRRELMLRVVMMVRPLSARIYMEYFSFQSGFWAKKMRVHHIRGQKKEAISTFRATRIVAELFTTFRGARRSTHSSLSWESSTGHGKNFASNWNVLPSLFQENVRRHLPDLDSM